MAIAGHMVLPNIRGQQNVGEHLYTLIIFLVFLNFWFSSTLLAMNKGDEGY